MLDDQIVDEIETKTMYIPKIKTENLGEEKYIIKDFDLDLEQMKYAPIANDILLKNLLILVRGYRYSEKRN